MIEVINYFQAYLLMFSTNTQDVELVVILNIYITLLQDFK